MFNSRRLISLKHIWRRMSSEAAEVAKTAEEAPPVKVPLKKRIEFYLKQIYYDYREALIETGQSMKEKPVKTGVILSTLVLCRYLSKHNPSEGSFHDQLVRHRQDLMLLGGPIRNPESDNHIQTIAQQCNAGVLRRFSLGVCSVMWEDRFDPAVNNYEARCKDLSVGWVEMWSRVVDFGILDRWTWMEMAMMDYDINPTEWPQDEAQEKKWQRYLKEWMNAKK
ncbi:hypothetical protein CAPTEDRAFT_178561 [Capitella teleta]|uniref:Uncharacterized protein n=1 Tax=Capitella teleta TaxID=283909 RepID=R7TL74_CAPTE|nr:hypothetical protein CAPTEDRAFT_178561 [Capitella teleta]|eukprot:ELT94598.1 hypothetical protein CAPTEDRAFT_178561 [Capitella teleta]